MKLIRDFAIVAVGGLIILWLLGVSGVFDKKEPEIIENIGGVPQEETQDISLYFYNPDLDLDASGNIKCSRDGLAEVKRTIALTQTPIQDAIRLVLKGELTAEERAQGITTEFPLEGVELVGVSNNNGNILVEFRDPLNKTGGGSCRVGILWFQIERTILQFPDIKSVRFVPEELFQP